MTGRLQLLGLLDARLVGGAGALSQTGPSAELLALNRTSRGLVLQLLVSVVVLLIIIDMIWKPGA